MINKELAEYLAGQRNAVRDTFILSREKANGSEYVSVSLPDDPTPIYNLWTKKKQRGKPTEATGEIVKPKHIGGKRPYIMLMQDQQDAIYNLSNDAAALLIKLMAGGFIAWETGEIVDRRSKKPLTSGILKKRFNFGEIKMKAILKELNEQGIIMYDRSKRAYFLDRKIAKKGGGVNAD